MADFLFVYRNENKAPDSSPDELQKYMQKWTEWIEKGFAEGWMVNAGDALQMEGKVVKAENVVTDGPFVESKEVVGGYSVIRADSIDAAAELAKGCPALITDGPFPAGSVEVRPLAGLAPPQE